MSRAERLAPLQAPKGCPLDGQQVTKEAFDAWYAENLVGDVTWYSPGGSVIPEGQ